LQFEDLNIIMPILKALESEGYTQPTPIQEQAIPIILSGKDIMGCAQTGTGKTAAFAIPILQLLYEKKSTEVVADGSEGKKLHFKRIKAGENHADEASAGIKPVMALILTPTRELALQIGESFDIYGKNLDLKCAVIYGGVSQANQTAILKKGVDILVATPGRLLDLIGQHYINLRHIQYFVLDEADRMLDMGFAPDVRRIIGMLPKVRQTMLFSATLPMEIMRLEKAILTNPEEVSITPVSPVVDAIEQHVYHLAKINKRHLLVHLLQDLVLKSVLVFSRTRHGADRIYRELRNAGISAAVIS